MESLIDSSVWIAVFLDTDPQHSKALRLTEELKGTIYLPYCVVNEVASVVTYKHSKEQSEFFFDFIRDNHQIIFIDDAVEDEISFYRSLSNRISFTDGALMHLSKKLRVPLITFDRQLEKLAKKHIRTQFWRDI